MSEVNDFNKQMVDEFRANHGKLGGMFEGGTMLLLHHNGAKSGTERVNPLAYQRLDSGYAVFASKGGAPTNPDWYHNLKAHPDVSVEVGDDTIPVRARVAEGDEREAIWTKQKATVASVRRLRAEHRPTDPGRHPRTPLTRHRLLTGPRHTWCVRKRSAAGGGERLPLGEVVREHELRARRLLLAQPGEGLPLTIGVVGVRRQRVEVEGEAAVAGVADQDRLTLHDERLVP